VIKLRFLSAVLLFAASVSSAPADVVFFIGEPAADTIKSGIGQISGWAVSDREIVSVEAFIDEVSIGIVPYGGTRQDVAAAYPDYPNSEFSGWSMKWNYALLEDGEHRLRIVVSEDDGSQWVQELDFLVTAFNSEFISDPLEVRTTDAIVYSPEDGRIVIEGAEIEGEIADIELSWDTGSQQFLIDRIDYLLADNQAPSAFAGSNLTVEAGDPVTINGDASDSDGSIVAWQWQQVSGPVVSLSNANSNQVQFTAPYAASVIRLRLTVNDDDGATDSDDVMVTVQEPPPPPPPNQAPSANAGSDRTVEQGENVVITGSANDVDGSIVSWSWQQVSGPGVSLSGANSIEVSFIAPGTTGDIRLRLTVTDDDGATDSDDVMITVTVQEPPPPPPPPPNQAPSANAGSDRTVEQGDNVVITGSASDPDGSIVSWSWQQISGSAVSLNGANSNQVSFTAPGTAGDIRLRLTVTDDDGASDSDDVIVSVREDPGQDSTTGATLESMLPLINQARGVSRSCGGTEYAAQPALQWSNSLASVAQEHSMDMARQGYFSHTSLDGTSMGTRVFAAWSGSTVGENIASSSVNRSDSFVVDLWLNSPGHCALIMDPDFTHAGVGFGQNTENNYTYHYFWTLDFGG